MLCFNGGYFDTDPRCSNRLSSLLFVLFSFVISHCHASIMVIFNDCKCCFLFFFLFFFFFAVFFFFFFFFFVVVLFYLYFHFLYACVNDLNCPSKISLSHPPLVVFLLT